MVKRVLIADDENHVCIELDYILSQEPMVKVVSICSSGDEALDYICRYKPDIVFLDIAMPGLDGIKLGRYLSNMKNPAYIIYITAYDKYAVEAIQVGAKGYILKPFSEEQVKSELAKALDYLKEMESRNISGITGSSSESHHLARISGEVDGKIRLFDQERILMAYAKDRSVYLSSEGTDILCHFSLADLEKRLSSEIFFRCHRNYIVNLYRIKEIIPWFNSTLLLIMEDKNRIEVPVSRNKVKLFKERIYF